MVWYGLVWYGMVWCGLVWYGMVSFGMVWFGMVWFGMVWFFVFQLVNVVLVSICTKFELSMCLVCPTIEINVCSAYLQNVLVRFSKLT